MTCVFCQVQGLRLSRCAKLCAGFASYCIILHRFMAVVVLHYLCGQQLLLTIVCMRKRERGDSRPTEMFHDGCILLQCYCQPPLLVGLLCCLCCLVATAPIGEVTGAPRGTLTLHGFHCLKCTCCNMHVTPETICCYYCDRSFNQPRAPVLQPVLLGTFP
jgi:hypothetical protein